MGSIGISLTKPKSVLIEGEKENHLGANSFLVTEYPVQKVKGLGYNPTVPRYFPGFSLERKRVPMI